MEKHHSAAAEHALSLLLLLLSLASLALSATDPNDLAILNQLRKNIENPELLKWPENGDDPCGARWAHVFCAGSRVSQIQVQNLGLKGPLPQNFNQLTELTNIGLQRNHFSGPLPSLKGLSKLRFAYLDFNDFTSIPVDFFEGLDSLEVLALDDNNLNATTGWNFPPQLGNSAQLQNLSCMSCNLVGPLPHFLGNMSSLTVLQLSGNGLSGEIPPSFNGLNLQILWLNNPTGGGLSGPIDVLTTMMQLNSVWLHGNQFSGVIPNSIGNLTSLKDLNLNQNQFVGLLPDGLANLALDSLNLNNNHLMGPIPKFKARNASFDSNAFCQSTPGVPCAAEVMALIEFLDGLNYPSTLVSKWSGNDPCGSWLGVSCGNNGKVSVINLPNYNLNGTLSPSVAMLESLVQIRLQNNNLQGLVPETWTSVKSLTELDLSGNNVSPPLPKFSSTVKVAVDGNRLFNGNPSAAGAAPEDSSSSSTDSGSHVKDRNVKKLPILISSAVLLLGMLIVGSILYIVKKKLRNEGVRKKDLRKEYLGEEREDMELPLFDFTTVAKATDHFSSGNKLGEGGFGSVYKGTLMGGKEVAVKRLSKNSGQGMREFKNEVMLIAKLQHRNLVKLLGCCTQEDEKILIYEFMPNRSLDFFIFEQEGQKLLDWTKCFHIIGGIARGLLYLHHDSRLRIIHRDLKVSNILLDDNMNPKIADFGLAKIFDSDQSQANTNRVVGTYGYMSPEYAADGIVSMKSDVYSFGVILLEMLSRKKNRGFSHPDHHLNLLGHAWTLWMQDKQLELIDKTLSDSCNIYEVVRCLHVGLLCVQRVPEDRPSMPSVILMLSSDVALPAPKQPGFYTGRIIPESSSRMLPCSENTFSITLIEPR